MQSLRLDTRPMSRLSMKNTGVVMKEKTLGSASLFIQQVLQTSDSADLHYSSLLKEGKNKKEGKD